MTRVTLHVLGNPVPMPRARVVRGKSGKVHAFTPEEAVQAKERIQMAARLVRLPFFVGPLVMDLDVHLPTDGITYWKRGSGDRDNYEKLVSDALEGIAFANDACIVDGRTRKLPATDGTPRLVICLEGEPGSPMPTHKRTKNPKLFVVPAVYRR